MSIAEYIKKKRTENKLSQIELAEKVGVSPMTIRRWEWGQRLPRADELSRLAAALNTTVSYLTGETDVPDRGASAAGEQHIQIIGRAVELDVYSLAACMGYGKDNENEPREKTGTAWLDERVVGPLQPVILFHNATGNSSLCPKNARDQREQSRTPHMQHGLTDIPLRHSLRNM